MIKEFLRRLWRRVKWVGAEAIEDVVEATLVDLSDEPGTIQRHQEIRREIGILRQQERENHRVFQEKEGRTYTTEERRG